MPHITIECSANLRERVDLPALVEHLHAAALETGVFPIGGLRTRVAERDDYRIADGHPENAFIHVELAIGEGRDAETRKRAASHVFDALCAALDEVFVRTPLGISLELREIDAATSFKRNNLHDYVEKRREHP